MVYRHMHYHKAARIMPSCDVPHQFLMNLWGQLPCTLLCSSATTREISSHHFMYNARLPTQTLLIAYAS
jgi:hypothetical protein